MAVVLLFGMVLGEVCNRIPPNNTNLNQLVLNVLVAMEQDKNNVIYATVMDMEELVMYVMEQVGVMADIVGVILVEEQD